MTNVKKNTCNFYWNFITMEKLSWGINHQSSCQTVMLLTWLNCEFISCRSCSATTLAVAVAVAVAAATIAAALNAEGEGWYCWGPPPSCTPGLPGPPPVPPPPVFIPPTVDWGPPYPPPTPLNRAVWVEASKATRSWEKHVFKTLTLTDRGYCVMQILPAYKLWHKQHNASILKKKPVLYSRLKHSPLSSYELASLSRLIHNKIHPTLKMEVLSSFETLVTKLHNAESYSTIW